LNKNIPKKKDSKLYERYLGVRSAIELCQQKQRENEKIQAEKVAEMSCEQRIREEKILEYYKHRKKLKFFNIPS